MSLTLSLLTALSGLQTNQAALQVTANNVANVNTDGYSRKVAEAQAVILDGAGAGVTLSDISRDVDAQLLAETHQALSSLATLDVQQSYYQRIQNLFGQPDGNTTVGAHLNDLGATLLALSATPESSVLQTDAVAVATTLTRQINDLADEIQELRTEADRDITQKLTDANDQMELIAELNADIARGLALGDSTADLQDQRDLALRRLSELIEVNSFTRDTGQLVVTTPDGRILVDSVAATLTHDASSQLGASISYPGGIDGINLAGTDITGSIVGGEIGGLIEMRDSTLPDLQAELDQLTQMLRDEINQVHNSGAGLPPASGLSGTRDFADPTTDTVSFTADVRIGVVDANNDFVAYYDLPAGSYTVSAIEGLIDANLAGFASASTSTGGPLSIDADDPANGIAIVDLGTNTVTHTDGVTTYDGFSYYFGLNDLFVTPGATAGDAVTGIAGILEVRADIVADEGRLSRGALDDATGVDAPAAGDPASAAGDSSVVQALADKFYESLSFPAAGGLPARAMTLADYGTEIVADNSMAASRLESDVAHRRSVYDQLSYRQQSDSGVNLDEEFANMIIYQNAYSASAQIVSTTQELFAVLERMVS